MKNKQDIAEILDQSLAQMRAGASYEDVLFNFTEYKEELSPLLKTLEMGLDIPLKNIPKPDLQRKYLQTKPIPNFWEKYFAYTKFALMPLGLIIVLASTAAAYANPGQPLLYGIKKAAQRAPLALISNPDVKAAKTIELSEKNLNEAEAYLNSKHEASAIDLNVVADLTKQTSETIASVKDLAASKAIADKNNDLLNKLVSITQKQEKIVSAIKPQDQKPTENKSLKSSQEETSKSVAEINKLVATVNDQVIASLKKEDELPETPKNEKPKADKPKTTVNSEKEEQKNEEVIKQESQSEVLGSFIVEYPTTNP